MLTGRPALVGTFLLVLVDMGWAIVGPSNWGNGQCSMGNMQLSMVAKIVQTSEVTSRELNIPVMSTVTCSNASAGTDVYKIWVTWVFWDAEPVTYPKPTLSSSYPADQSSKVTQPTEEATKSSIKEEETTVQPKKSLENRDSPKLFHPQNRADRGMDEETDSSTWKIDDETSSIHHHNVDDGSATSGFSEVRLAAATESQTVDTSTTISSVPPESTQESATNEVPTTSEVSTEHSRSDSILRKSVADILHPCPPYFNIDSEEVGDSSRAPGLHSNRLELTLTKRKSSFMVSDIHLRYMPPDDKVYYMVFWNNVNLFPGPLNATHVCENVTRLPLNDHADLLLQNVQLAAFLPPDQCEYPKETADCSSPYERDEANKFCRNSEVILIAIGALLGVLLVGCLGFYAGKLYCNARRDRDTRDALP